MRERHRAYKTNHTFPESKSSNWKLELLFQSNPTPKLKSVPFQLLRRLFLLNMLEFGANEDTVGNECSMKQKKAQTQSMFLTGRQVACMIYEHVRIRDTDGTVLDISETGLSDGCWSEAVERSCYLKDIQDSLADGRTPYVMRFHARFDGAVWPSGAAILRMPILSERPRSSSPVSRKDLGWHFSQGTPCTREVGGQGTCSSQTGKI